MWVWKEYPAKQKEVGASTIGRYGLITAALCGPQEGDCLRWVMGLKDKADDDFDVKQENDCCDP